MPTASIRDGDGRPERLFGRPEVHLVLLLLLSRVLLELTGVTVHQVALGSWQLLDPELLRNDLASSLFHLHSQPPLYNLFMGTLLKLSTDPVVLARAVDLFHLLLGLLLGLMLYRLMRRLDVNPPLSFGAAALFMLSPATLLYENYAYYTYPSAVLLGLCAFLFARTVSRFTPASAFALFMAMAALIGLRALFQLEWFLALTAFCLWVLPGRRRQVLLAAALPLLLLAALYAKNLVITGQLSTSSWLGMSLSKLTTMKLPAAQRHDLVQAGRLSPLALQEPFSGPERYPRHFNAARTTGIPVLDRERKSIGSVNFNHLAYAAVSDQYLDDALAVIRTHPRTYLTSMATAYRIYFQPAGDFPFLEDNRSRIMPLSRLYNLLVAGQPVYPETTDFSPPDAGSLGYFIIAGFGLCIGYGAMLALRALRRPGPIPAADAVLMFLWLNLLYVTVIGNAVEIGENQRFRYLINPLLTAMLAAIAMRTVRWGRIRSGRGTAAAAPAGDAAS